MPRGRRWTPEEEEIIAKMYAEGASVDEIAEKLPPGRTVSAVTMQVKRLGLERGSIVSTMKKSIVGTIEGAEVMSREEALKVLAAVIKRLQEGGPMDEVELGRLRTIVSAIGRYFVVFDSYEKYAELEERVRGLEENRLRV